MSSCPREQIQGAKERKSGRKWTDFQVEARLSWGVVWAPTPRPASPSVAAASFLVLLELRPPLLFSHSPSSSHGSDIAPAARLPPRPLPTWLWKRGRPGRDVVEEELLCVRRRSSGWGAGAGDPQNHDLHRTQQRPEQQAGAEQLLPQQRPAGQLVCRLLPWRQPSPLETSKPELSSENGFNNIKDSSSSSLDHSDQAVKFFCVFFFFFYTFFLKF